jgi:ABC-type transport system involved in multi-copper enzyme maturation permease subunit
MPVELLYYRPWRGRLATPVRSVWPIARLSLAMMFRRRLFWVLYGLSMIIFCVFFFGQYMLFWAETQLGEGRVPVLGMLVRPQYLINLFRDSLKFNGTGETYRNFFWYQGYMAMIVLALAGSLLIGNDIRHGSLSFYLSKPLSGRHYLAGKFLAVAVFINLLTTLPALVLFVQYGLLDTYDYFSDSGHLILGILGYGLVLTIVLSLLLIAMAVAVRKTVPLIMIWTGIFFFFRRLGEALVDGFHFDPRWKLIDLWNDTYLVGNALLDLDLKKIPGQHPSLTEASLVLLAVSATCLIYLIRRIRAVEVVS